MPKKKASLVSKLGSRGRKAHEQHKGDETTYNAGDLPEGIEGGIAELVDCKFDVYKSGEHKGEFYFYAGATVKKPETFKGRKIKGMTTSVMEPLCDTPKYSRKTVEEHLDRIYNELRKLGVDTDSIEFEDLEDVAATLKEEAPTIEFRTWKGKPTPDYPNPRVNHVWNGLIEYNEDEDEEVEEEVEEDEEETEEEPEAIDEEPEEEYEEEDSEEEETEEEEATEDLDELAALADDQDTDAEVRLASLAEEAGVDYNLFETWAEVATAIQKAQAGDSEEEEDEEEEYEEEETEEVATATTNGEPELGDVYLFKPLGKGGRKLRKAVECEVIKILKNGKLHLKNLDTGKRIVDPLTNKVLPVDPSELEEDDIAF